MKDNISNKIAYLFRCKVYLWLDFSKICINDYLKMGFLTEATFYA